MYFHFTSFKAAVEYLQNAPEKKKSISTSTISQSLDNPGVCRCNESTLVKSQNVHIELEDLRIPVGRKSYNFLFSRKNKKNKNEILEASRKVRSRRFGATSSETRFSGWSHLFHHRYLTDETSYLASIIHSSDANIPSGHFWVALRLICPLGFKRRTHCNKYPRTITFYRRS